MVEPRRNRNLADAAFAVIGWVATAVLLAGLVAIPLLFRALVRFWKTYSYNADFFGFSPAYILWTTRQINVLAAVTAIVVLLPLACFSGRMLFFTRSRSRPHKTILAFVTLCLISATLGSVHSLVYYWKPDLYTIDHEIASEYAESVRGELQNAIEIVTRRKAEADTLAGKLRDQSSEIPLNRRIGHIRHDDYLEMYTGKIEFEGEPLSIELKRGFTVSTIEVHHGDRFFLMSGVTGRDAGIMNKIYKECFAPIYAAPHSLPLSHIPVILNYQSMNCTDLAKQFRAEQDNSLEAILPWHLFALDTIGSSLSVSSGHFKPRRALSRAFLLIHGAFILAIISALAQRASAPPSLDPNRDYPYLIKHIASKLDIRPYDVSALIWRLQFKGNANFHLEVHAGKLPVHKYSEDALDRIREELESCADRVKFIKTVNSEYRAAQKTA